MENSTPPAPSAQSTPATTSLVARLLNVFVVPGEVFDEVKCGVSHTANWLAPVALGCLMAIVFSLVVFSQDRIIYSIREAQQKQIQKQVEAGKLKKEQAEMALNFMERFVSPTVLKISGAAGGIAGNFGQLFLAALIVWLIGAKAFKAQFGYMQAVEVCGLASMISVVGSVITMFLVVIMGSLQATPGPILFIREIDPANKLHLLLASLNVMTLWYVGVIAVGLSRLSRVSFGQTAAWLYGVWAILTLVMVLPGWGR